MATERNKYSEIFIDMLNDSMDRYSLNQSGLASKLGKNRSMVTKWLNKQQVPYIGTVNEIAKVLNYSITKRNNSWTLSRIQDRQLDETEANTPFNEIRFCTDIVAKVLGQVYKEAPDDDKTVLGRYFFEIQNKFNQLYESMSKNEAIEGLSSSSDLSDS